MKTYKQILWSLAVISTLLIAATGCKKYLDRTPLTATLEDLHQGSLEAQSFGLYSTLRTYAGFSLLPWLDFNSIRDYDPQKRPNTTHSPAVNPTFSPFHYTHHTC